MSESIAELAAREAEAAELEYPDEQDPDAEPDELEPEPDTGPEPDPDGEPDPAPEPPSDVAAERALDAIGKAADAYTKKVAKIQAATPLELVECPLCPIPGYVQVPRPPEMPEHVLLAVESYLAGPEPGMRQHPALERCDTCDGWGNMTTGARAGMIQQPCPDCNGQGYRDKRTVNELERMNGATVPVAPAPAPPVPVPAPFGEQVAGAIVQ